MGVIVAEATITEMDPGDPRGAVNGEAGAAVKGARSRVGVRGGTMSDGGTMRMLQSPAGKEPPLLRAGGAPQFRVWTQPMQIFLNVFTPHGV
jgi:hypothetical protein